MPALLEQSHTRTWLKGLVRSWCKAVAWLFDLHSYLLGDGNGQQMPDDHQQGNNNGDVPPAVPIQQGGDGGGGLGAAHQAFLLREGPTGETKSRNFYISTREKKFQLLYWRRL